MKYITYCSLFCAILLSVISLQIEGSDRQLAENQTANNTTERTNTTNSFLVLRAIKHDMDELASERKREQDELVKKVPEETFGEGEVKKPTIPLQFLSAARSKRSQDESGFSEEIVRLIEGLPTGSFYAFRNMHISIILELISIFILSDNFPCRDPKTMALIRSGTTYFNEAECSQCTCHMAKLTCEKDLKKCHPNACRLQNGEFVRNFALHNDGCNNCLCYFGKHAKQGRRKMKKVRGALRALKAQVLLGGPGTHPRIFFYF